ncbi:MAG: hypothetical protein RL695_2134 [Pseudomonadota bacterium]
MGLTRFFITPALREQAALLVAQFMVDAASRNKKAKGKIDAPAIDGSLNQLYAGVTGYVREQKLGALRRAAFALAIQDALREQKLPPEVVSKVTSALVMNALIPQKKS